MNNIPQSARLFRLYQPKFRTVAWRPVGFGPENPREPAVFHFETQHKNVMCDAQARLYINDAGLRFSFTYDPRKGAGPVSQLVDVAWRVIQEEVFRGRAFYADPDGCAMFGYVTAKFSCEGDPIRGLVFPKNLRAPWHFFIPEGTPESAAIMAALTLEQERKFVEDEKRRKVKMPNLAALEAKLAEAIAAVPGCRRA